MTETTNAPDPCATCGKPAGTCFGCAVTEADRAPDMQTTWPKTAKEATADRMILCGAHHAMHLDARHDVLYAAVPWDDDETPEKGAAIRRWADAIAATVTAAQYTALLVEMQKRSREDADAAAQRIWEMTEAGDWLIEPLWDYLSTRGIDPAKVAREAEEAAQRWGADRTNRKEERCPLCGGLNGTHGLVHTRHGNGGGSNNPCPHRSIRSEETR